MAISKNKQVISVEVNDDGHTNDPFLAYSFSDDAPYRLCPVHYGATLGEAAGKVLAWLIDNNADVSRLEVHRNV